MGYVNWKKGFLENLTPADAAKFEGNAAKETPVSQVTDIDIDDAANEYAAKTECAVVAARGFKAGVEWAKEHLREL